MKKLLFLLALLIFVNNAFSQTNDKKADEIWKNYEKMDNSFSGDLNHAIFLDQDIDKEYNTTEKIYLKLQLKEQYDTLFRKFNETFKWVINPMPEGASFNIKTKEFTWHPAVSQMGKHNITFYVKFNDIIDSLTVTFNIVEEWQSSWLPGVSFSYYQPTNKSKYGSFYGPSVEYLMYSWIHRNENRGPSHGRLYLKLDLLSSTQDTITECFLYSIGVNLSLERNARRNYLIPFYGLEMGGFYHKETNNIFYLAPIAGVWIYSSQNLFITADVKYQFPTSYFEELKGVKGNIGFNFSLW
jgi:hypothetical protein